MENRKRIDENEIFKNNKYFLKTGIEELQLIRVE